MQILHVYTKKNKEHTHERGDVDAELSLQIAWSVPEERSFRLFPSLVLLSSFSWVSLSNRLLFWSFWRGSGALSWAKSAVLLTLSLSWPEENTHKQILNNKVFAILVTAYTEDSSPFEYLHCSCALCSSCGDSWSWASCFGRPGSLVQRPCAQP